MRAYAGHARHGSRVTDMRVMTRWGAGAAVRDRSVVQDRVGLDEMAAGEVRI